ncbi:MAG: DUF2793 domain-containing protein [Sphingomonadales bacterium]|nr:DUF2793 domain-containing protein [Sphingomonadales bacterium]
MPQMQTARHKMPILFSGQAQKELTHNEALTVIDALINPVVIDEIAAPPVNLTENDAGKCWLVAPSAQDDWAGHDKKIAYWTGGSWRFLAAYDGMTIWNSAISAYCFYKLGEWSSANNINDATGGNVVDGEARLAVNAILALIRQIGLIRS